MKTGFLVPLSLLVAVGLTTTLTSCSTLANRRDMFTPGGQEGPYTKKLREMNQPAQTLVWK